MTRLIVNADDFGFFDGVSRGILALAEQGRVTATGVMANGPALPNWLDELRRWSVNDAFSVGVHLNATLGEPFTHEMRRALLQIHSMDTLPDKSVLLRAVLLKRLPLSVLLQEWRAQIDHCLRMGLKLSFVNSHEHVHMLPGVYPAVRRLAAEYGIRHVRAPDAEWPYPWSLSGAMRGAALAIIKTVAARANEPHLLGLAPSGRLDARYSQWRLARLHAGIAYELMCHPGDDDAQAKAEPKLAVYHDWSREQQWLSSVDFGELLARHGIRLVSYQQLSS